MRPDLHDYTAAARAALAARLEARAAARGAAGRWHAARARGVRDRPARVAACGTEVASVTRCDHGTARVVARACRDSHACPRCAAARMRRGYARLLSSVDAALRESARGRGRRRDILRLLTLTVRHSGDLRLDRDRLQRAWARHRAWWATVARVRPRYWLAWECAPGSDGTGHVHAHVLLLAPWYDYRRAHAAWTRHTDGESVRYDVRTVRPSRRRAGTGPADAVLAQRATTLRDAVRAIAYVGAYVTSSEAKAMALEVKTHARWWAASYGRRALAAHRGAWVEYVPACPCCGAVVRWVAPDPAARRDPAAALAALARTMSALGVSLAPA